MVAICFSGPMSDAAPFRWKEKLDPPYRPVELRPELNPNYREGDIEKAKAEARVMAELLKPQKTESRTSTPTQGSKKKVLFVYKRRLGSKN